MKLARSLLLLAIALSPPLFGQSLAKTFVLNAANQCAPIGTSQLPTIGIDVSGTFSLTLTPYVVINGQTKRASQVTPSNSNTPQATITSAGGYTDPFVGGYDSFLLCVTTYSSGSVVIWLNPSPALNGSLFGGGGGGGSGVSSFNTRTGAVVSVADDYAAVPGLDLGDGTSVIDFDTVDGILGFGDQPVSPEPGSDDDCTLGPYVTGASSNGIVCWGANGTHFSIDNDANTGVDGADLDTDASGVIEMSAGGIDSQQSVNGWYSSKILTSDMHALTARCAAVGSAASPSVANCQHNAGCPSETAGLDCAGGAFSCDTAASGATCVVQTSRVCANTMGCANSLQTISTIFVSQVTDESGILGVTCNPLPVTAMVSARSDGVSFTVTLGTFTVHPVCFNFEIN